MKPHMLRLIKTLMGIVSAGAFLAGDGSSPCPSDIPPTGGTPALQFIFTDDIYKNDLLCYINYICFDKRMIKRRET